MMKFDKVVQDIKSYWLAAHKTVKEFKVEYERYYPEDKKSVIEVRWKEANPERLGEQFHSLIEGGKKFGLFMYDKYGSAWFEEEINIYNCGVELTYKEEF